MTQIREWVHGGFYCKCWFGSAGRYTEVGRMSGSEHSSSIETDLESVEVPLEVTVVVLVKHQ